MNLARLEQRRTAALEEIRAAAWQQIGERGAVSLSLRGIARQMGVSATALYRYYPDRDALVAALLVEAFTSFGDALEAARDALPADDHAGRLRALCKAYFSWALQNPQHYELLFGTPIPGHLFTQEVGPAAQRSFLILQGVIGEARLAGKLSGEFALPRMSLRLKTHYEALRHMGMPYTSVDTHLGLSVWAMMHGIASLCLHQYLSGFLQQDVEAFVDFEIERLARMLGFA